MSACSELAFSDKLGTGKRVNVSWRDDYPMPRKFGHFIRWQSEYAVVRYGAATVKIHRSQLTFEN